MIGTLVFFFFLITYLLHDVNCNFDYEYYKTEGKIVGGNFTTIEEHPEQAFVLVRKDKKLNNCGGSILDDSTILTAAHCVNGARAVYAIVGVADPYSKDPKLISAKSITIHESYNEKFKDYDVAVIRLSSKIPIDGVKVKAVKLVERNAEVAIGRKVTVTGWGKTSEGGSGSSKLKSVDLFITSWTDCQKVYNNLTPRMICAGVEDGGKDSCQGDSGGPAMFSDSGKQVGIVSFGLGCARAGNPGVYVNVGNPQIRRFIIDNSNYKD